MNNKFKFKAFIKWLWPLDTIIILLASNFILREALQLVPNLSDENIISIITALYEVIGLSLIVVGMNKEKKVFHSIRDWWLSFMSPNTVINLKGSITTSTAMNGNLTVKSRDDSIEKLRDDLDKLSSELSIFKKEIINVIEATKSEMKVDIKKIKSEEIHSFHKHLEVIGLFLSIFGIIIGILG